MWQDWLQDYTLRNVSLGAGLLGVVAGCLGCFALLRRQGLVGDAMAHAALPGVCVAFLLTGQKSPWVLMAGAFVAGAIGLWLVNHSVRGPKVDAGSALATVLTTFFGFGVVLLTVIQKSPSANQAGIDKFLFGQAAALTVDQVVPMAWVGGTALAVMVLLFKEFKLFCFDPILSEGLGRSPGLLASLLSMLWLAAIVIGLNTVGVVLMASMLVAPGAGARQWTNRLQPMVVIAGAAGGLSGIFGAWLSVLYPRLPTGPTIVLVLTAFVIISILFGTARGLVWVRRRRTAEALA